jgi:hypothetical protein
LYFQVFEFLAKTIEFLAKPIPANHPITIASQYGEFGMAKDAVQTNLFLHRKAHDAGKRLAKMRGWSFAHLVERMLRHLQDIDRKMFSPEEDALYMRGDLDPEQCEIIFARWKAQQRDLRARVEAECARADLAEAKFRQLLSERGPQPRLVNQGGA